MAKTRAGNVAIKLFKAKIDIICGEYGFLDTRLIVAKNFKEAYKKANIKYPISRLKIYGAAKSDIKNRARRFENEIIRLLSLLGEVKRNIKTKRGVIDALVNVNNKGIVVEIKDYKAKPISYSDVKQLNR